MNEGPMNITEYNENPGDSILRLRGDSFTKDRCYINELPGELLARIFHYFHPVEDQLPVMSLVCREWRILLKHSAILWRSLKINPTRYRHWHFALVCSIFRVYGHHIQSLIWREQSPVYESVFSLIPRLKNLRYLRLPVLWTRAVVESLAPLTSMEQVQINGGYSLTDVDLIQIARYFPHLREVSLNACWQVTAEGVLDFLEMLPSLESVKLKINSGLSLNDIRSDRAMSEGARIVQHLAESDFSGLVTVLCLHFVPVEMEELWDWVKTFSNLKKLCISNCENLHGIRLLSSSLQKLYLYNLWNVVFISVEADSLRVTEIDYGLESMEHLELFSAKLRRIAVNGSDMLRTLNIRSERLAILELCYCEELEMSSLRQTLQNNRNIICLKIGCISQDSLTLDEFTVPSVQELCLLADFACETLHVRSPSLRLLHTESESDIITVTHIYIIANHLCKVALIGLPSLKTMTIQCVSVDSIELNLCSDDQLVLDSCVIQALTAVGFLRFFDCKLNLLSICTPLARTIVLYRCQMTDYVLQMGLTGCSNIAHLNLEKCRSLQQVAIQQCLLRYLNMFGCSQLQRLYLDCPELLALNLGECAESIRLFLKGIEEDLSELCYQKHVVIPKESIRWTHTFPPQVYTCN
ncbi:F-box/LRR-repeat protein 15-like [Argonauta hians]